MAFTAFGLMRLFALVFLGAVQPKTRRAPEVAWQVAIPPSPSRLLLC
ncbi:hypothetical protein HCU40_23910 [Pseudanabaena biceps]|nr:hypothetical protein [Pseudanabaena biceps]